MYCKVLICLAAAAAQVAGKTPSGFAPTSNTDLIVTYGKTAAQNGIVVAQDATKTEPTIATTAQLTGSSYAVIMIDLDIPFDVNPHTLLHWMQTDLTPATAATSITTTNGTSRVFTLSNTKNTTAFASYIGPGPPAKNPLSHRYTQILVDTSAITTQGSAALKSAAASRQGFNIETVLKSAGLSSSVVAGNSFNVTNPGPAEAATGSNNSTTGRGGSGTGRGNSTTGTGGRNATGTGAASPSRTSGGTVISTGGASAQAPSSHMAIFVLFMAGVGLGL